VPPDDLFIDEIVAACPDERYLTGAKIGPFVLSMAQTAYLSLGAPAGRAWEIGKAGIEKG
jgi:hypothetical protein